jgi:hypothetical protein
MVRAVWDALKRNKEPSFESVPPFSGDYREIPVFLSVSDGRSPASIFRGHAADAGEALSEAAAKAMRAMPPAARRWVRVDFPRANTPVTGRGGDRTLTLDPSLWGLAVSSDPPIAFLPVELSVHRLADRSGRLYPDRISAYLGAGLEPVKNFSLTPDRMRRFRIDSWFVTEHGVEPLFRGHRMYDKAGPTQIRKALHLAGRYLSRATGAEGRFDYVYRAEVNDVPDAYNIVRHAGTVYSMFQLYRLNEDPELGDAVSRAARYLIARVRPPCVERRPGACVVAEGKTKLGANALSILALVEGYRATGKTRYLETAQKLARWIVATTAGNGRFQVHTQYYPGGKVKPFRSRYYPGEAIFSLARLYGVRPDKKWIETAEKAAFYLIQVRDADLPLKRLDHDHWLLYGLNELHLHRERQTFRAHSRRLTAAIIGSQNTSPAVADWLGSYSRPPRSTRTAIRSEGLCAGYSLERRSCRAQRARKLLKAIRRGIDFQLSTQIRAPQAMFLPDPPRALGGFRGDLTGHDIRIDYVQHNISALIQCLRILEETSPSFVREIQGD